MLVEELAVVDTTSPLWETMRPVLEAALRLEVSDATSSWHGWNKAQVEAFLGRCPSHCSILVAVWETLRDEQGRERDMLRIGWVGELRDGQVRAIYTLDTFTTAGLSAIEELEPGYEHALEMLRVAKARVAPVAWALFTDKATWDTWLFATASDGGVLDKGVLLTSLTRQGRCVLMGSQAGHHH